jgi:hypothetical protein
MSNKTTIIQQVAAEVTKHFVDQGKLVEAGFAAFSYLYLKNSPPAQIADMRIAYMSGAEHLFNSIMGILDPGEEPTDKDMQRMDLINAEIERWRKVFAEKVPTKGSA